jgi:hypothetical protein
MIYPNPSRIKQVSLSSAAPKTTIMLLHMTKAIRRELQGKTIVAVRLACHPEEHDRFRAFWLELDSENMGDFGRCGITDGLHKYCNLSFGLLLEAPTFPANRSGACNHGLAVSEPTQPCHNGLLSIPTLYSFEAHS